MHTPLRVLFSGGGTGGHLCPAVAVAQALIEARPSSEVLFLGSGKELERRILAPTGFRYEVVSTAPLARGRELRFAWDQSRGLMQAWSLLREFRPHVVLGLGGFVSVPGVLAARLQGIPVALFEPNAVPGKANVALARIAREAYVHWDATSLATRLVPTGAPLNARALAHRGVPRQVAQAQLEVPGDGPLILIMGGSQGARALNDWVVDGLAGAASVARRARFLHLAGKDDELPRLREAYAEAQVAATVLPFLHDVGLAYRAADLAVVRAGGATLAELQALGVPALVVPMAGLAGDHQVRNAVAFAEAGCGQVVPQDELGPGTLARAVQLARDTQRLAALAVRAREAGRPDAARDVASRLAELAGATRHDTQRAA
jgi:UDP-N-acetylglucosamine--N-acetylmuramyl-(pentapeptide) pyrophosphoryl-undecaprenol N-acetylglucosamine transferase